MGWEVTPGLRGAGSRGQRGSKGTGEETGHGDAVAVNRAPGLMQVQAFLERSVIQGHRSFPHRLETSSEQTCVQIPAPYALGESPKPNSPLSV